MSDDIVKRLRDQGRATFQQYSPGMWKLCSEAAERIEALEKALRRIDAINDSPAIFNKDIDDVCRAALAPEQDK